MMTTAESIDRFVRFARNATLANMDTIFQMEGSWTMRTALSRMLTTDPLGWWDSLDDGARTRAIELMGGEA